MAKAPAPRKPTTAENLQATLNNPNVRKFLDMLSVMEGTTTHGYNTTFGGGRVESLDRHPNLQREFKQTDGTTNSSGAFGRYGFMPDTWAGLRRQYPEQTKDMSQQSQDFGAVALIAGRGALQDVVNGRFGTAVNKVGAEWASLPTSPYKQPKKSWDDVNKALGLQVPAAAAGGAKAANAQALTPEQGKKLYDVYKAGRMSPEQRADYERDFATIQKPAGATMLRAAAAPTGGSGGSGGAPVAPAQAAQATAKTAPYVLPVEIIMAYNDGSMNPQQRAEFERDYKAGAIAAPRHIPFELKGAQPAQGYLGRVGDSLSNLGSAMGEEGGGGSLLGLAEGVAALGSGLAGQVIGGIAGGADLLTGGLTGRTDADAAATVKLAQDMMTYQPRLATGQASLGVMNTAVGEPFLAAQQGLGGAVYSTTGGALQLAQRAGLPISQQTIDETAARNAALTEGGFAALTTVLNPATPVRAAANAVRGRPAAVRPPPINATPVAPTASPFSTPDAATQAANSPTAIRDFVRGQREPLATNPASLAAQAEVMPRPDVARPATTLTPDNPTVTIQPDGGTSRPAGVVNPVLDGTYISSKTGKPYETAEAAQNSLMLGRLEATHEVSAIDGGYGLTPKRNAATPEPAAAGTVTTVGEGGLNVMHGSTRSDLTADQIQVFSPNAKQGKRRKDGRPPTKYGGFYATTDAASAQRYANMGKEGSVPTVYDVQIKAGSNILDSAGDITRLSESAIAQHRASGVDVVRGKDPRGQVEYAIINPEAVGALKPRAKPTSSSTASAPAPNRQTASDITNGFNAIAIAAESASRSDVGRNITTGKADRLTMYKPEAIAAAESNPNYNTSRNPDGSVTIIGVKTDESGWIGVEPRTQPTAKPAAPKTAQGKAFTTSQKPVAFEYDVVPIESVVKSTNADLTPNKAARPELQPRNRDSDASALQINTITNLLNPEWLAESPKFSDGAPTVFGNEAVAGHGRLAAIERRYAQGVGDEYRQFIIQKAAELGINPARLAGVERPVLVRRVKDDADAQMIAQDSNAPTTLRMTTGEQARIDAKALPDLGKLARGEDGEMNIPASYDFIRDFMGALPVAERGDLTADGRISQNAVRRIQAAVSEKAYQDADLIARFTEAADADGKRISSALQKQAGAVAALAEAAAKGERYPTTIGADLAQAANKYADIKATGLTVKNYLDQGKLVDDGLSAGAIEALVFFGENANSGRAISEYIQGKIAEVEAKGNPMQDSLFQSSRAQKEAEAVRKRYEGTPEWMRAPNGTPTKLSERQWVQVRTPSFKEWFGDWENNPKGASKVVDENGEPLVVYHGTGADFHTFDASRLSENTGNDGHYGAGIYFSIEKAEAGTYGKDIISSFLDIKRPVRNSVKSLEPFAEQFGYEKEFKTVDKNWLAGEIKKKDQNAGILASLYAEGYTVDNVWPEFEKRGGKYQSEINLDDIGDVFENIDKSIGYYNRKFIEETIGEIPEGKKIYGYDKELDILDITDRGNAGRWFSNTIREAGHDGVIAGSEFVVFNPNQIKSATGNSGAFDGANPNIYMQANKPQAAAIGERIAEQAKAAGRPAKEATQAGKLAEAYYAATAKALGLTPDEVFAKVGLSVERGNVGGANAALRLGEREHAMVFGDNANASSFVHEAGHHFLETHAKLADQSPKLQSDVAAVMTWAGHDGRKWSDLSASQKREVHEKFAESFEQYLLTGKPPTKGLKGVFENFKQWLTEVYTSLAEFAATNPRANISPDILGVMDRMLGGNKAEKAANAARGKGRKKSAPITGELLDFKRSAPVAGGVSPALHQARYDVLRDIGLTDDQIRGGSVEGDRKRLEWDAELAKYDTEYGIKMKQQLELERQKLREYGDGVVDSMGGTAKATPETRGAAIVRPLEAYQAWYRDKIKAFYKLADEQGAMTGGIELRGLEAKLKEDSAYHNDALQGMRKSVRSFLFEQRLLDTRGNIKPMSAKQAETVRKHLNSIRTFETGSVIGELNALIDDAVFSTLNRSVYGEARAVNTQYHRIFSNPKGMAALLDVDGINRKISHEKVAANVAALAETNAVQFRHIMRQLEDMPTPELQKMADQAIGEIRAQIAEKITAYDSTKPETVAAIGKALAPYRGGKLREIFGEKGAQKLETFVAAHGILRKVDAQPSGTSSMTRNVIMKLAEAGTAMVGGSAGLATGGAYGAAAGTLIGQQIGARIKGSMVAAVDKKSYGKAMSPRQLETMRQSYDASGRRLAALPETEAATAAAAADPNSTRARVTNARLERTKQWIEFYSKLTDEQKAAVKKIGAAAWLLSVSGLGDNQTNDDGENR